MEAGSGSTEVAVVGADPVGGTTVLSLPEGASMMIGEDGEQYVTIAQDGQTYAIPLTEYQTMQPGGTITIQVIDLRPNVFILLFKFGHFLYLYRVDLDIKNDISIIGVNFDIFNLYHERTTFKNTSGFLLATGVPTNDFEK